MNLSLKRFNKKILLILFFIFSFFFAHITFAANLNFSPSSGSYDVGDTISVRVNLSSPDQSANAVSGVVSFSKDLLTLDSISKSSSLISLWALEPSYSNINGTASMEGVILNGYTGSSGNIITLLFRAKAAGTANIEFVSSSVLANDGQGTNILVNSGKANFNIAKATTKETVSVVEKNSNITTPSIKIEELKKSDEMSTSSKFLVTSVGKKAKSSYQIQIDGIEYPWVNSSSGIFETQQLPKGVHTIVVSMETVDNKTISSNLSFSINTILVPSFIEYSDNIKEKEYIVVKGLADPNIDVLVDLNAVVSNGNKAFNDEVAITSDEKGLFTYVSDKALSGIYEITAYSVTKGGIKSQKSLPIKVNVLSTTVPITVGIMNTFSALIPILALLILLIILAVWGWYKVLHYRENLHSRLLHTKSLISKSFTILDDDVNEQIKILKKVKALQPLNEDERVFVNQFKKDIEAAESAIISDIKEV